jgi:HNH endonuclease
MDGSATGLARVGHLHPEGGVEPHRKRAVSPRQGEQTTPSNPMTADHITPQYHGGQDTPMNLRPMCRRCNSRRGRVVSSPEDPEAFHPANDPRKIFLGKDSGLKWCRHCGLEKPTEAFRRNPRCRDGLSSWCAECHRQAQRDWRSRNRERELAKQRERYRARRDEVLRLEREAYFARLRRQWEAIGKAG